MSAPRSSPGTVACAICGQPCKLVDSDPDGSGALGGWYCEPCDVFSETDVEVED